MFPDPGQQVDALPRREEGELSQLVVGAVSRCPGLSFPQWKLAGLDWRFLLTLRLTVQSQSNGNY